MPIRPFDGPVLQRAEPTCEPSMRPPFVRPRICGAHLQDTLQYTANQTNGNVLTKFKQLTARPLAPIVPQPQSPNPEAQGIEGCCMATSLLLRVHSSHWECPFWWSQSWGMQSPGVAKVRSQCTLVPCPDGPCSHRSWVLCLVERSSPVPTPHSWWVGQHHSTPGCIDTS